MKFRRPLKPHHSENEWRELNRLQYRQPGAPRKSDGPTHEAAESQDGEPPREEQLRVGSATFNIRHVEKLVVQHIPVDQADGDTLQSSQE